MINLYIYSSKGSDLLTGSADPLFLEARAAKEAKDAVVEFDNKTDSNNPVIIVQKGVTTIKMPINRNVAYVNDEPVMLGGIVLLNGWNAFVPQEAADLIAE